SLPLSSRFVRGIRTPPALETRDVVDNVARYDPQARRREPERHHGTGEPSPGAERTLGAGVVVPEVERANLLVPLPVPDDVLGPVAGMPEHRERQPRGVRGQVER